MNTVFIYALKDPDTSAVRYVGKAKDPIKRLRTHFEETKYGKNNHRLHWLRSLDGKVPILEIVDEVTELEWPSWEVAYIQFFKDEGCNLVNGTLGGDAPPRGKKGHKMSDEQKAKLSVGRMGRFKGEKSPLFGKVGPWKGKKHSVETLNKMRETWSKKRAWNLGKKMSNETRLKISATLKGKMAGDKHPQFGKLASLETRAKISSSLKEYHAHTQR